jgi:hypothetical protein
MSAEVLAGTGDVFSPASLGAALLFWVDATLSGSITQSGGLVSAWADQSGNGHNLSQATGANKPTYHATGAGGANLPYLSTSGGTVAANMATAANWTPTQAFDLFIVSSWTTSNAFKYLCDGAGGGNTLAILSNNSSVKLAIDSGSLLSSGTITVPGWATYNATFAGNSSQLTVAGVQVIPSGAAGSTAASGLTLFNNQSISAAVNAGVGEVVGATGISSGQRAQVIAYLQSKWGVT